MATAVAAQAAPPQPQQSLAERLDKIKSPKLQNQHHTAVVLSAVEDTLRDQKTDFTPTAYFAALLALLAQAVSPQAIQNRDLAISIIYLLDIVTSYVPQPLLRSKFGQIFECLVPALTLEDAEAPLLKPSIGCLESLLLAQDMAAWNLGVQVVGPRRALGGLLALAVDHRPKVRKRAQDAVTDVLKNPPPSPSLDHPAADMCAETALRGLTEGVAASVGKQKGKKGKDAVNEPALMHSLQLVKTVAAASGGWPSKKIEPLCEVLMSISRSSNEYLTMGAFEVFEIIFEGMADDFASSKLPRLMEAITELQPDQNDSQLLPPWIAVLSRGYDVSAQIAPQETFEKLPALFEMVSAFLASPSNNIRVSASECLISFLANCIPDSVVLEPSIYDEKTLEKLSRAVADLLSIKYQTAWMQVFNVVSGMFDALKWRAHPVCDGLVKTIGDLRSNDSFHGKKEADSVLQHAITAVGPVAVLELLPLNLAKPKAGQPGRAWMLPILRDSVHNTSLAHFRTEFVPLSETMFQRVLDHGSEEKTMEVKIFETLVQQIWALLPGYCDLPNDLNVGFDQSFAEMLANLLYKQAELRVDVCRALQNLVESNKQIIALVEEDGEEDLIVQRRVTKEQAEANLAYLATFAGNLLAVLFNVYSQTLPQYRGFILQCINAYLSITPEQELIETFSRVTGMLESSLPSPEDAKKRPVPSADRMPPTSHTLMDLVITISIYLPRTSFGTLFQLASVTLNNHATDPQLIKKAYKLIPRLATSAAGAEALKERSSELQALILTTASNTPSPARRDRLLAIDEIISHLPTADLHFIPAVLSEVVLACKESNEKARTAGFNLLIHLAQRIANDELNPPGTVIRNSLVPHMGPDTPDAPATLEEFLTMVSAGLAGSSPHMVAASITALSRLLFEYHSQVPQAVLSDLVQTLDLFLTSSNREIVRSVLGFVKVAVVVLPDDLLKPRLESLVPNLMVWSKEHKARLRSKVKGILERLVRRFGAALIEQLVGDEDRKVVVAIRKERERRKRKKKEGKTTRGGEDSDDDDADAGSEEEDDRFDSAFDRAIYDSDSEGEGDEERSRDRQSRGAKGKQQYIREHSPSSNPLDLLDPAALASISSSKPALRLRDARKLAAAGGRQNKAKTDLDGKLIFGDDDEDPDILMTAADGHTTASSAGGVDAYVSAISGPDAAKRGQKGRLKFAGQGKVKDNGDQDVDMDVDEEVEVGRKLGQQQRGGRGGRGGDRGRGGRGRGGGFRGAMQQRRGLGAERSGGRGGGRGGRGGRGGGIRKH